MTDKLPHQSRSSVRREDDRRSVDDPAVPDYLSADEILHLSPVAVERRNNERNLSSSQRKEVLHQSGDSNIRWENDCRTVVDDPGVPDYLSTDEFLHVPPSSAERTSVQNLSSSQQKETVDDDPWGIGSFFAMVDVVVESVVAMANLVLGYDDGGTTTEDNDGSKTQHETNGHVSKDQHGEERIPQRRRKSAGGVVSYSGVESLRPPPIDGARGFAAGYRQQSFRGLESSSYNGSSRNVDSHESSFDASAHRCEAEGGRPEEIRPSGEFWRRNSIQSIADLVKDSLSSLIGETAEDADSHTIGDRDVRNYESPTALDKGRLDDPYGYSIQNYDDRGDITNSNPRIRSNSDMEVRRPSTTQRSSILDSGKSHHRRRHSRGSIVGERPSNRSVDRFFDEDRRAAEKHELVRRKQTSSSGDTNNNTFHPRKYVLEDDDLVDMRGFEMRRKSSTMRSTGADFRRSSHKSGHRVHSSASLDKATKNASDGDSVASGSWSCSTGSHSVSLHDEQVCGTENSQSDASSICIDSPTCAALLAKHERLEAQPRRSSVILNQSGSLSVSHLDLLTDTTEAEPRAIASFEVDCGKNTRRPSTASVLSPMIHGLLEQAVGVSQPQEGRCMGGKSKSRKDLFAETDNLDDSVASILRSRRLRGSFLELDSKNGLVPD